MRTKVKYYVQIAGALLLVCTLVAGMLAVVNHFTKDRIFENANAEKLRTLRAFFPEMTTFEEQSSPPAGVDSILLAYEGQTLLGYAVSLSNNLGWGGEMSLLVGLEPDGTLIAARVLRHSETFLDRYVDEEGYYHGADRSAGASLSHQALTTAVATAQAAIDGGAGEEAKLEQTLASYFSRMTRFEEIASELPGVERILPVYRGDVLLGYGVEVTNSLGWRGETTLLVGLEPDGTLMTARVMSSGDTYLHHYLDEEGYYNGAEAQAGATKSYTAITTGMQTARDAILALRAAEVQRTLETYFPEMTTFEEQSSEEEGVDRLLLVYADDVLLGYAVEVTNNLGWSGRMSLLVGLETDGTLIAARVLLSADTYLHHYLDEERDYHGAEAQAGATKSYTAITTAIATARSAVGK
ncbi:MAG: FMN-binding protein [Eubacteriales bacterium]